MSRRAKNAFSLGAKLRLALVLLGANAWSAIAFCPLAQAQPSPARRAFAGRVTTDNGLPIGGAAITIRRQATGSAAFWGTVLYSDARGDFSFSNAEDGEYSVAVEAGGLARFGGSYILGEKTPFLKVALDRLATISLRVLRPDGTPLASAPVSVLMRENTRGELVTRQAATDSSGAIAFPDATPGLVSMRVVAPRVGYADLIDLQIAPGSRSAASDARLQAGATLRITTREKAIANAGDAAKTDAAKTDANKAVASRVLGGVNVVLKFSSDGSRFAGVLLAGLYDNTQGNLVTRDGENASEVLALAPGRYAVSLARNNYGSPAAQDIEIKAGETASLEFEMRRADGVAIGQIALVAKGAKAQVLANRDIFVGMEMLAANADTVASYAWRKARTDAGGRAVLYPVEAGRWRIRPRIAANSDARADQNSPAAPPQTATVAPLAPPAEPAALTFPFAVE